MGVTTVRLSNELLRSLDWLRKKEKTDRSTIMKKALEIGIKELRLEEALKRYGEGKMSAWRAAQEADMTLGEFIEELRKRGLYFKTDEAEMERMLEEFK